MTPEEYKAKRKRLGTQQQAAGKIGCSRMSIFRRETGRRPVTREAAKAIEALTKEGK